MLKRRKYEDYEFEYIKLHKNNKTIIICSICFVLILLFVVTLYIYNNKTNYKIYNNVYLNGENISNYTEEDLETYLKNKDKELESKVIEVVHDGNELLDVYSQDINFKIDIEKTLKNCLNFGRDENILVNNYNILKASITKKDLSIYYLYDEEKMEEVIKNIDLSVPKRYSNDTYNLDEIKNSLIIKRGITGNGINEEKVEEDIYNLLKSNSNIVYNLELIQIDAKKIDIDEIYKDVKRDPKDAYISNENDKIDFVTEQIGYDFNKDDLIEFLEKKENQEEGKELEYKLQVIEPSVKLVDLDYSKYAEELSKFTTYFNYTSYNRASNLKVALSYLDDNIIMPGETFSVTDTLGGITTSQGYKAASTFKGGVVVQEIGGGVCQTSSTLYNAALLAGLEIVERHPHSLPVGYVKPSQDATIYTGVLDLKFKNTRKYPVKIETSYSASGSISISIYGIKEETEYEYEISSVYMYTIPYKTIYKYDSNYDKGYSSVISSGVNGYSSEAYLIKKLDGKIISKELLSKDTYSSLNKIVKVGVKEGE